MTNEAASLQEEIKLFGFGFARVVVALASPSGCTALLDMLVASHIEAGCLGEESYIEC